MSSWGGQIYLVYLPERERYAVPRTAELDDEIHKTVMRVARVSGARSHRRPCGISVARGSLEFFPFRLRGHYNEQGHRLVGETVLQALSAANLKPVVISP